MHKHLITACMACVALMAFAIVPAASASPVLTKGGMVVAPGTEVTGRNTGVIYLTGGKLSTCGSADMTLKVTSNSGTKIKGEVAANNFSISGDCTSIFGGFSIALKSKLCLETVEGTDNMRMTGCGANITLATESCNYSAPVMTGTFVTNADLTLNVSEQLFKRGENEIFCPQEWKLDFFLNFTAISGETLAVS